MVNKGNLTLPSHISKTVPENCYSPQRTATISGNWNFSPGETLTFGENLFISTKARGEQVLCYLHKL